MITESMLTVTYLGAAILFILALGGLSSNDKARRGNLYGMLGMAIAVLVTILANVKANGGVLASVVLIGGVLGFVLARKVKMTQMPELVAILHSMVGLAAVIIGYAHFIDTKQVFTDTEELIHELEIFIGIYIGGLTFTGSVIAYGKLSAIISGKPLLLPGRHFLNLILLLTVIILGWLFITADSHTEALQPLYVMIFIAFIFGIHMVVSIGGADMPVVISMLNSYSGWAAAATGFMLSNDLMIVTGALVGSSGAILSYIMCKAMNRNFISVISGGFGTTTATLTSTILGSQSDVNEITVAETAMSLKQAKRIMIVPGYCMAMAQAQYAVSEISRLLMAKGVNVRFGIHPVAGRMPGHMNVLLAEAKVPYDIIFEMDEINEDFPNIDVSIFIGANDTVNSSALEDDNSPISGMPVLKVWNSKLCIVLKRGMQTGYSGVENPLFFKENTRMLFGDAKSVLDELVQQLQE